MWCATAHTVRPAGGKTNVVLRASTTIASSHIRHDIVIPDTGPVADVFATRGVFGRIAPLITCGPKV